jgi:hypothetical protein
MWERLEDHVENVPQSVRTAAEALLAETLADPQADPVLRVVSGWRLEAVSVEYRRPQGRSIDVMDAIIARAAQEELDERLEDLENEEPGLIYEAFTFGNTADGAIVIVRAPQTWWVAEPLKKLSDLGLLYDRSSGNDACPSLGAELLDGSTVTIFTGHPHPDHHTREGCDPRFAIFLGDEEWEINWKEGPAWAGENEEEAARQALRIMEEHGGPRRRLRPV